MTPFSSSPSSFIICLDFAGGCLPSQREPGPLLPPQRFHIFSLNNISSPFFSLSTILNKKKPCPQFFSHVWDKIILCRRVSVCELFLGSIISFLHFGMVENLRHQIFLYKKFLAQTFPHPVFFCDQWTNRCSSQ